MIQLPTALDSIKAELVDLLEAGFLETLGGVKRKGDRLEVTGRLDQIQEVVDGIGDD